MHRRWHIGFLVWLLILASGQIAVEAGESQQIDRHKGLTVDELTRGVRGAVQNIEKEIPKIGPAIGKTMKSRGGHGSESTQPQKPPANTR